MNIPRMSSPLPSIWSGLIIFLQSLLKLSFTLKPLQITFTKISSPSQNFSSPTVCWLFPLHFWKLCTILNISSKVPDRNRWSTEYSVWKEFHRRTIHKGVGESTTPAMICITSKMSNHGETNITLGNKGVREKGRPWRDWIPDLRCSLRNPKHKKNQFSGLSSLPPSVLPILWLQPDRGQRPKCSTLQFLLPECKAAQKIHKWVVPQASSLFLFTYWLTDTKIRSPIR